MTRTWVDSFKLISTMRQNQNNTFIDAQNSGMRRQIAVVRPDRKKTIVAQSSHRILCRFIFCVPPLSKQKRASRSLLKRKVPICRFMAISCESRYLAELFSSQIVYARSIYPADCTDKQHFSEIVVAHCFTIEEPHIRVVSVWKLLELLNAYLSEMGAFIENAPMNAPIPKFMKLLMNARQLMNERTVKRLFW